MTSSKKYLLLFFVIIGLLLLSFYFPPQNDDSSIGTSSKIETLKKTTPIPFKDTQQRPETESEITTKTQDKTFFCQIRNILHHYNMRRFYGEINVKNNSIFFYSPNKQNTKHINTFITTNSSLNDGKAVVYGSTVNGGLALSTRLSNSKTRLTGNWTPHPAETTNLHVTDQQKIVIRASENGQQCPEQTVDNTLVVQPVLKQPSSNSLDKALEETFATMDKRKAFAQQAQRIVANQEVTLEDNQGYIVINDGVISVYSLINGEKGTLNYRHSIDDTYQQGRIMVLGKKSNEDSFIINVQIPSDNKYYQVDSKGQPTVEY